MFVFVKVQLLYNVMLVSAVEQSKSAIRVRISPLCHQEHWTEFPVLHNRFLLVIYFIDFIFVSAEFYFSHLVHGIVFCVFACIQQIKDYTFMLIYSTNLYLGNSLVVQWWGLPRFHCQGYRFSLWWRNRDPASLTAEKQINKKLCSLIYWTNVCQEIGPGAAEMNCAWPCLPLAGCLSPATCQYPLGNDWCLGPPSKEVVLAWIEAETLSCNRRPEAGRDLCWKREVRYDGIGAKRPMRLAHEWPLSTAAGTAMTPELGPKWLHPPGMQNLVRGLDSTLRWK